MKKMLVALAALARATAPGIVSRRDTRDATHSRIALIAALALLAVSPQSRAAVLDFTFTWTQSSGTVSGIVRGLTDGVSNQAAASVEILSHSGGFGIGEYEGGALYDNAWTVDGGSITSVFFTSFGLYNGPAQVTCCSLGIVVNSGQNSAGLTDRPDFANYVLGTPVFTRVQPVPAPPSALLFGTALALGAVARRRPRRAA